ncbi:MAG: hypothetical protein ABI377_13080 [Devosia sp.]
MADYKELIRKAIQALPENNGAARRAVYEKARAALVGQLRGLNPPLAARDITQHRLQLEDCIRQVEQEASEAVIAGLKQNENVPFRQAALPPPRPPARPALTASSTRPAQGSAARPNGATAPRQNGSAAPVRPAAVMPAVPRPTVAKPQSNGPVPRIAAVQPKNGNAAAAVAPATRQSSIARPAPRPQVAAYPRVVVQPEPELEDEPETIEDIISAAENDLGDSIEFEEAQPEVYEDEADGDEPEPPMFKIEARPQRRTEVAVQPRADTRPMPAIVARAEAAKAARSEKAPESSRRTNGDDGYRNGAAQPGRAPANGRSRNGEPIQLPRPTGGNAAMSSVREVDVENHGEGDPQIAIERAIATLEREARNDEDDIDNGVDADDELPPARSPNSGRRRNGEQDYRETSMTADQGFARAPVERERGGGSAVTIFLLVFLALLVAVGGAGLWAWHEGFIDFDAMFGKTAAVQTSSTAAPAASPDTASADNTPATAPEPAAQTNTEAASTTPAQSSAPLSAGPATPAPATAAPAAAEPSAQAGGAPKTEERLTQSGTADATPATPGAATPAPGAAVAGGGSQSLLLEASQDGTTGAVPFSGTVDWSKGTDEMGQPTLVGKASIPARNLGVSVLIRKNSDPTLPASHLMEINFTVNDSFIGGSIAGLPGVLLKNEELVQGTPLVGASARVVGNSFLFALSSSAADEATNKDLLTSRKWMDLAIIYATGKKAIITLEKDDKTEQLFNDVFAAWAKIAAATPAPAAPAAPATAASPPGAVKSK